MRFLNIFPSARDEGAPVRVRILEPITITPYGEKSRGAKIGEELLISERTWGQCEGSVELVSRLREGKPKPKPIVLEAPRVERRELPADLLALPKPFQRSWTLSEEYTCRRRELGMAFEMRTLGFGLAAGNEAVSARFAGEARCTAIFDDAEKRLHEFDHRALWDARFEANKLVLAEVAEVSRLIDELHQIAFSAFSERLAPLGLCRAKAESLFYGSALFVRFCQIQTPNRGEQRSMGCLPGSYSEESTAAIIARYRNAKSIREQVEKLLPEAKKELANAKKAMRSVA